MLTKPRGPLPGLFQKASPESYNGWSASISLQGHCLKLPATPGASQPDCTLGDVALKQRGPSACSLHARFCTPALCSQEPPCYRAAASSETAGSPAASAGVWVCESLRSSTTLLLSRPEERQKEDDLQGGADLPGGSRGSCARKGLVGTRWPLPHPGRPRDLLLCSCPCGYNCVPRSFFQALDKSRLRVARLPGFKSYLHCLG